MLREFIATAMLCAALSPAHARKVEMMAFTREASPLSGAERGAVQASSEDGSLLVASLASEFASLGTPDPIAGSAPLPTDGIGIPLWLQTGVAPLAGSRTFSPSLATIPAVPMVGCGDTSYRRRHDLPASTETRRAQLFPLVAQVACEAGIPVGLFDALVTQESRYRVDALSLKGAAGLSQLMPGTASELGVRNIWDPLENLRGGALYLRQQLNEFGRVDLALAAYNAGPGRVRARRRIPAIAETMNYVDAITRAWRGTLSTATVSSAPVKRSAAPSPTIRFATVELARYEGHPGPSDR